MLDLMLKFLNEVYWEAKFSTASILLTVMILHLNNAFSFSQREITVFTTLKKELLCE